MACKIAVINHKGGVGKTTITVNLAAEAAAREKKVMLIDMDLQGNSSQYLGVDYLLRVGDPDKPGSEANRDLGLVLQGNAGLLEVSYPVIRKEFLSKPQEGEDIFEYEDIDDRTGQIVAKQYRGTQLDNFHVVPAYERLTDTGYPENFLVNLDAEIMARKVKDIDDKYDYVFYDCPPSLSKLTAAAIIGANMVIVPIRPGRFELYGVRSILEFLMRVKSAHKNAASFGFAIMNGFRAQILRHKHFYRQAHELLEGRLADQYIPFSDEAVISAKESSPFAFNPKTKSLRDAFTILYNEMNEFWAKMEAKNG